MGNAEYMGVPSLELRVTIWQQICCDLGSGTMKNGRTLTSATLLLFSLALVQARLDTSGEHKSSIHTYYLYH